MQIINPPWPVQIPVIDLRSGEADPKTEVERLIREEVQRPFDLARGPLLRARLLRIGDAEHIYLVGMHHIAGDGWSMEVFLQDLAALYDAFLLNKPSPLPELPFQYVDYASWQRGWLEGQVMERQLDYWKARLKGMPHALELPAISSRPDAPSHQGREYSFMLSSELSASIQALSRAHGVTLFVTLLTAFQALLSRYSGQTDIAVGGAIANRSGQMDALMGFFVNSLVLRTDLSGRPSFTELLHRVQEVVLGALANQDVPFERLVEELQPQRDMSRTPLFQVMFDLQRPMSIQSASLAITEEAFEYPMEKFDLSLRIVAVRDGLKGILLYQTDLFDAETITGIANHLEVLLTSVTASPERPIEEIPLLTQAEEKLVLGEWNRTERAYPSERSLQELFERQVDADPKALALVQGGSRLTYSDLNRRANQLAHYLLSRASGRRFQSASALSAASRWSSPCSPSSRPEAFSPARPGLPGRPTRTDDRRHRPPTRHHRGHLPRPVLGPRRRHGCRLHREPPRRTRLAQSREPAAGQLRRRPGLRHLHLGLDRRPEGHHGPPPRRRAPGHQHRLRRPRARRPRRAGLERLLRRRDLRDLGRAAQRRGLRHHR